MLFKTDITKKQTLTLVILLLIILVLIVYWPVQNYEFTNYDDPVYVTENYRLQQGINFNNITAAFTDVSTGHWHPLTTMSHMLDGHLFRDKSGGHHWTSVIIHILNSVLLFLFLRMATGAIWPSAFVAALFAVHPINVESVAWIAERKNVLSTFFWILTMISYIWYVKSPGWKRYLPVFFCFALGLMSKVMLVTLPFVLLLLDYWPLNRTKIKNQNEDQMTDAAITVKKEKLSFLILEKAPLFVLSAISAYLAIYAAKSVETISMLESLPLINRVNNAVISYALYIKKMFWPVDLAVIYPFTYDISFWHVILAASLVIVITIIICVYFRRFPYLPVGWFWYLGILVPVIGIFQVGSQSMADRYAYVPLIGLFIMISWGMFGILKKLASTKIITIIVAVILVTLIIFTYFQVKYWKNTFVLFAHTVSVTKNNFIAHEGLARELVKKNKINEAIEHYKMALLSKPDKDAAYSSFVGMGAALNMQGKNDEAIAAFRQAINIIPEKAEAYRNLCFVLEKKGKREEAIEVYRKATGQYNNPDIYDNFGVFLLKQGRYEEAVIQYHQLLRIQPSSARAHNNLGVVLMRLRRDDEAEKHFREAIRLGLEYPQSHFHLAGILQKKGLKKEAAYHYQEASRINEKFIVFP